MKATWPPGSSILGMWHEAQFSLLTGQTLARDVAVVVETDAEVAEDDALEDFAAVWQA